MLIYAQPLKLEVHPFFCKAKTRKQFENLSRRSANEKNKPNREEETGELRSTYSCTEELCHLSL
jgi:hypothetical protein